MVGVRDAVSVSQQRAHRQRAPHEPIGEFGEITPGVGFELVQAAFHFRVDLRARAPEQGRVHVAEAHIAGQVADVLLTLLRGGDKAVEHREPVVGHQRRQGVAPAQPPAQDRHDDRRGTLDPRNRLVDAQQGLLQLRGTSQRPDAVARQGAP